MSRTQALGAAAMARFAQKAQGFCRREEVGWRDMPLEVSRIHSAWLQHQGTPRREVACRSFVPLKPKRCPRDAYDCVRAERHRRSLLPLLRLRLPHHLKALSSRMRRRRTSEQVLATRKDLGPRQTLQSKWTRCASVSSNWKSASLSFSSRLDTFYFAVYVA